MSIPDTGPLVADLSSEQTHNMPLSPYVAAIRARIGHDLLLLPSVGAAVFDERGRLLLGRHADDGLWGTLGGAVEPGEDPKVAVVREVAEEVGIAVAIDGVIGTYGGPEFQITYPNGERVAFVSTFYACRVLPEDAPMAALDDEISGSGWFTRAQALALNRRPWSDRTIPDAFDWWAAR